MVSEERLREAIPSLAALGITSPALLAMEERAVAYIQTQTRRYFGPVVRITEYLAGIGGYNLRLSEKAVEFDSDLTVIVEERCRPGATATTIRSNQFEVRDSDITSFLVRLDGCFWRPFAEYAVTYYQGYNEDDGPKDIEQLIIDLIALRAKFLDKSGMRGETIGGYSYTRFGDGDLDGIEGGRSTINSWKRMVIA